ncbi:homoserine acetyltransferase, partial [Roseomonas sp. DSM 102946]|nr:homoserine acetyltransferase [Roseomonas sp. DSM 102946]
MTPRRMLPPLLLGLAAALRGILPAQAQSAAQNAAPGQAPASSDPAGELALVERKNFEIAGFTTRGGATVGRMRIGYQTAGTLDAAGGNAVLITHPFVANG